MFFGLIMKVFVKVCSQVFFLEATTQKNDLDLDEAVVEIEEDVNLRSTSFKSEKVKNDGYIAKENIIFEILKNEQRFNKVQKISGGLFTMGTDEMITKDGETPSRK